METIYIVVEPRSKIIEVESRETTIIPQSRSSEITVKG